MVLFYYILSNVILSNFANTFPLHLDVSRIFLSVIDRPIEQQSFIEWYEIVHHPKYVSCGSGAFSWEDGSIARLPLPRNVVRGDYLVCLAM